MNEPTKPAECATDEPRRPRYVVGIDLGTTNSAMCFVDTDVARWTISTFMIAQVVAEGQVERLETLPSFHYEALPAASLCHGKRVTPDKRSTGNAS